MKRIKIMLLSTVLLAALGGTLAFKAKFNRTFCITEASSINNQWTCSDAQGVALACPDKVLTSITNGAAFPTIYCSTTTVNNANCDQLPCAAPTLRLTNDN